MTDHLEKFTENELKKFELEATVTVEHGWGASYEYIDTNKLARLVERAARMDEINQKESRHGTN